MHYTHKDAHTHTERIKTLGKQVIIAGHNTSTEPLNTDRQSQQLWGCWMYLYSSSSLSLRLLGGDREKKRFSVRHSLIESAAAHTQFKMKHLVRLGKLQSNWPSYQDGLLAIWWKTTHWSAFFFYSHIRAVRRRSRKRDSLLHCWQDDNGNTIRPSWTHLALHERRSQRRRRASTLSISSPPASMLNTTARWLYIKPVADPPFYGAPINLIMNPWQINCWETHTCLTVIKSKHQVFAKGCFNCTLLVALVVTSKWPGETLSDFHLYIYV